MNNLPIQNSFLDALVPYVASLSHSDKQGFCIEMWLPETVRLDPEILKQYFIKAEVEVCRQPFSDKVSSTFKGEFKDSTLWTYLVDAFFKHNGDRIKVVDISEKESSINWSNNQKLLP